jgi:hypothetical protein
MGGKSRTEMRSAIYRGDGAPTGDHGLQRAGIVENVDLLRIALSELQSEAGFIDVSVRPGLTSLEPGPALLRAGARLGTPRAAITIRHAHWLARPVCSNCGSRDVDG